jgi:hypothetical protein
MNPISLEYAAGFFDGEGCVMFRRHVQKHRKTGSLNNSMRLFTNVNHTHLGILLQLRERWGGQVKYKPNKNLQDNRKDQYIWRLSSGRAKQFVQDVSPFIIVKRAQFDLALAFIAWRALPMRERCIRVPSGKGKLGNPWRRSPEALATEEAFKAKLHALNRRGRNPAEEGVA